MMMITLNRPTVPMALALALTHSTVANTQSSPQRAQPAMPEFEVGSVRPSGPNQREMNGLYIQFLAHRQENIPEVCPFLTGKAR